MNPLMGRFSSMDSFEGNDGDPQSLHKYLYCGKDPVNGVDPTGHMELTETQVTVAIVATIGAYAVFSTTHYGKQSNAALATVIWITVARSFEALTRSIEDLVVYSGNKHTGVVVDGLLEEELEHANQIGGYVATGGPQDPRNHWRADAKAFLQRAKNLVQKRLKNVPAKQAEYLNKLIKLPPRPALS
jgi:hypothetical protein